MAEPSRPTQTVVNGKVQASATVVATKLEREGSFQASATVVAPAPPPELDSHEEDTRNQDTEREVVKYDEITYQHKIYKGVGVSNPSLAYVWAVLPPNISDVEETKDLLDRLAKNTTVEQLEQTAEDLYDEAQNFIGLTVERYLYGVGKFTLQLYDNNYTDIETKLLKNKGIFAFKYGYTANPENASPWYVAFITSYSLQFQLEGVYLTINGISTGWVSNTTQRPIAYQEIKDMLNEDTLISDFVEYMATSPNLLNFSKDQVIIEKTKALRARGTGIDTNEKKHIAFNGVNSDTSFDLIVNTLVPFAENEQGQSGYVFFIEPTKDKPILHFHTVNYKTEEQKAKEKNEGRKLFTLFKNPNTVVRNFKPDWASSVLQLHGGGNVHTIGYDPHNKVILSSKEAISSAKKIHAEGGTKTFVTVQPNGEEESHGYIFSTAQTKAQMEAKLHSELHPKFLQAIKATLEIQGTPEIMMLETVAVHVYIPKGQQKLNNVTKKQQIHWISGDFKVSKIVDTISNGDFKTTLELITGARELLVEKAVAKPPETTKSPAEPTPNK